jgi:hypothetical protein
MDSDRYFHPEFGWLAPARRLRRELRVGFFSMLFGMGVGVVAAIALMIGTRDQGTTSVSPVAARRVVPASVSTEVSQDAPGKNGSVGLSINAVRARIGNEVSPSEPIKPDTANTPVGNSDRKNDETACDRNKFACLKETRRAGRRGVAGPPAANEGPPIASIPIGRAPTGMLQGTGRSDIAAGELTPERTTPSIFQQDLATTERSNSNAMSHKKSQKTAPTQRPQQHQEPIENYRRVTADWTNGVDENRPRVGRAYARDSSSSPLGFWDWSR